MALFRRILSGVVAAILLVQPAVASGSCCCGAKSTGRDMVASVEDSPVVSAGCPHCRAAAKQQNSKTSLGYLQSDDCECSPNSEAIPATVTQKRDVKSEVVVRSLWLPVEASRQPDVRRIETSQVNSLTGHVPLTVLLCRWLA
jgi:hypothetical protein